MKKILRIHGSSSYVIFDLEEEVIRGSGEFFAKDGKIAGFVVSSGSLKYEDGRYLTPEEQQELMVRYRQYKVRHNNTNWNLEFE